MSVIPGTPDPEGLLGTPFDDLITGYGGNDTLYGNSGNDLLYGGQGDDSLLGQFGNDTVYGETGNDHLEAGGDTDQLFGGAGNDYILVNDLNYDGESTAYGGADDDTVAVFGSGHGTAYGGDGSDLLLLSGASADALFVDLSTQVLDGHGSYPGVTFSSFERLSVFTGSGNDSIYGGDEADRLSVGNGDNLVDAKGGDDFVSYITRGASTLDGGDGFDTLAVNGGTASLYFIYDQFEGDVDDGQGSTLTGFERFEAYGGNLADIAGLGLGNDLFHGRGRSDTAFGNDGRDRIYGDAGTDSLEGGAGRDTLFGGHGADTIFGGDGNDFIGGGNDRSRDEVYGGDGDDTIRIGNGGDFMKGGQGQDIFEFIVTEAQTSDNMIGDFESGVDLLKFHGDLLKGGLDAGPLDPSRVSNGSLNGTQAQFLLNYIEDSNTSVLEWYPGAPSSSATLLVFFEGHITLSASDFLIV